MKNYLNDRDARVLAQMLMDISYMEIYEERWQKHNKNRSLQFIERSSLRLARLRLLNLENYPGMSQKEWENLQLAIADVKDTSQITTYSTVQCLLKTNYGGSGWFLNKYSKK